LPKARLGQSIFMDYIYHLLLHTTHYYIYITMPGMATGLFLYDLSGGRLGLALAPLVPVVYYFKKWEFGKAKTFPPPIFIQMSKKGFKPRDTSRS
jgi:hypothetical protein